MISRSEFFFRIVEAAHLRSSCDEAAAGAVIALDDSAVAVSSADAPTPESTCATVGHQYVTERVLVPDSGGMGGFSWQDVQRCKRTTHAVIGALVKALRSGTPVTGATIYCSGFPCIECAKAIISAGIQEVRVAIDGPGSGPAKALLTEAHVRWFVGMEETTN